ncbi:MAG: hypothetical protein ACXW11_12355, partial [Methylotenera sp.]
MRDWLTCIAIVLLVFLLIGRDCKAGDFRTGPHLLEQTTWLGIDAPAGGETEVRLDNDIYPIAGTTEWTSINVCLESAPGEMVFAKLVLLNSDNGQYYYDYMIKSWQGNACSGRQPFDIPIHVEHNIRVALLCRNYGNVPVRCRGKF